VHHTVSNGHLVALAFYHSNLRQVCVYKRLPFAYQFRRVFPKVNLQQREVLDRLFQVCRSSFFFFPSAALKLILSDTLLDMKGLKYLFMLSPMKPLGKCVWNQL